MTHSKLTNEIKLSKQHDGRDGTKIDKFIVHHAASTSHSGVVDMMVRETREVSANYVVSEKITCVVDEDRRAWTSGTFEWDARAITVETINDAGDPDWTVSDKTFDNLARLIADCAARYGFTINDKNVITHQELYKRYGVSYPTACPGDLQRRKAELLKLASKYRSGAKTATKPAKPKPPARAEQVKVTDGWAESGGVKVPSGSLMARVQKALKERRRYNGPVDGAAGPNTIKGIQTTIARGGDYRGPIDGVLGPNSAKAIQVYGQRWGGYKGPIDGDPRTKSWEAFALGLERP